MRLALPHSHLIIQASSRPIPVPILSICLTVYGYRLLVVGQGGNVWCVNHSQMQSVGFPVASAVILVPVRITFVPTLASALLRKHVVLTMYLSQSKGSRK